MKSIIKSSALLLLFVAMACGEATDQTQKAEDKTMEEPIAAEDENNTKSIVENYLNLKDALVKSDKETSSEIAEELVGAVSDSDIPNAQVIINTSKQIAATSDLEKQRAQFEQLSMAIYDLVQKEDLEITLYKQYCPMAFDNQGAYWLSNEKEIMNPYFGEKMLKCGKVQEEL